MGLFHYLLIIGIKSCYEKEKVKKYFSKKDFIIIEKTNNYVSLAHDSTWGKIEVLIGKTEVSIRTKIQNKVEIMNIIFSYLQELSKILGRDIKVYDFQSKILLDLSDRNELKSLYLKRQDQLKMYF